MTWSNDEQNMLTGDDMGVIKYWNKEMANIARIDPAHEAGIRAISTSPVDNKFASCGDDHKVMIWDYNTQQRETTINQGNDVKTVDWHPQKGLLVCGDKNYVITLLDPRIQPKGKQSKLRTIYDHKGEVSICSWNQNGDWFLSASRDQSQKLWDLRQMAEPIRTYQGQGAAVTSLAWHPVHSDLWVSGGMVRLPFPRPRQQTQQLLSCCWQDGSLAYWLASNEKPQANFKAHEAAVWAVSAERPSLADDLPRWAVCCSH